MIVTLLWLPADVFRCDLLGKFEFAHSVQKLAQQGVKNVGGCLMIIVTVSAATSRPLNLPPAMR